MPCLFLRSGTWPCLVLGHTSHLLYLYRQRRQRLFNSPFLSFVLYASMASSSSSSSPEIPHAQSTNIPEPYSFKYASQEDVLEDLSRYATIRIHPQSHSLLVLLILKSLHSESPGRRTVIRRTDLFSSRTSVGHVFLVMSLFALNPPSPFLTAIGTMKTSSVKKTQSFPLSLSRNSLPCFSTLVQCFSNGAMTTNKLSIPSCPTRLVYPYVVRSCSTTNGTRYCNWNCIFFSHLSLSQCVLVKGWKSSSGWGFPKGKINQDEEQYKCAIREVRSWQSFPSATF